MDKTAYVYAMYSYLLDIDLAFKGKDEEILKEISNLKNKIDSYQKNPSKETFEELDKSYRAFFTNDGKLKSVYKKVHDRVDNLGEMIFRTKQILYKFN